MATNTNSFNVLGLDFEQTKQSLKQFLSSQSTLKDYNFDGSVLSTILDVLAYNTHYQAFYSNMVANEAFLDSATLRSSVVSHAKSLGYVPNSIRSASATLTIDAVGASSNTYLSRGTEFIGTNSEGTQYRFVLLDTVFANGTTQKFESVKVYEGTLRRMSYVYDSSRKSGFLLTIPNNKTDVSTIKVRVQSSPSDTSGSGDVWSYATNYIDLKPTSKVFFLQEREQGIYEVFFGDNFLGSKPADGSLVVVEYLETNGTAANGITSFTTSVTGLQTITVVGQSSGGAEPESISRIKFLAPKFYQSQSRAVTENDYIAKVYREYPNTDSVIVYGGETVTPAQYGKVFIAIKPTSGNVLSTDEKTSLVRTLKETSSVVTISPVIVDPDYIDVIVDSLVTYDPARTTLQPGTLKALVVSYIFNYSSTSLESFGSSLYLSKIMQGINALDTSILGNQTSIRMRKSVPVATIAAFRGLQIDFKNPLYNPHLGHTPEFDPTDTSESVVTSTTFSHKNMDGNTVSNVMIADDGEGNIDLVTFDNDNTRRVVMHKIGTVDYVSGVVILSSKFMPITNNNLFSVTVKPKNQDLFVFENKILRVSRGYFDSVTVSLTTQTARKNVIRG
jgi:hypothetical protein